MLGNSESGTGGGKTGNRGARVKPEPQQAPVVETTPTPTWEQQQQHHQPESPILDDHQSSDSDLSDALTLARERLLISHALDNMAKLMTGDVSAKRVLYYFYYCLLPKIVTM